MREQLRRDMRRRRRMLTPAERAAAAGAVCATIARSGLLRRGMRVGIYLAARGELDTAPLIALAARRGCRVYVPVVVNRRNCQMSFARLAEPFRTNAFGIDEPARCTQRVPARWLDVAFLPVVAYGKAGERLGSGAGYYDRAFAYRHARRTWHKPQLLGLAYHWQHDAALENRGWDVPLDAVITDRGMVQFRATRATRGVQA